MTEENGATRGLVNQIPKGDFVQSLEKGLAVIRSFDSDHRVMSMSEIATRTRISKPAARRILLTLSALGYVSQSSEGFRLRPSVLDLGGAYLTSGELPSLVTPYLNDLNSNLREACSVGVLDGRSIVYIARATSRRRMVTFDVQVGTRIDPFSTSLGWVILADMSYDELAEFTKVYQASSRSNFEVEVDVSRLYEDLAVVRNRGWARISSGVEIGVETLAAPLKRADGKTIAGINLAVHTSRINRDRVESEFLPQLLEAQKAINDELAEIDSSMDLY